MRSLTPWSAIACLACASGCYLSHTLDDAVVERDGGVRDAPTPSGDLPFGVLYDHPDGAFREVFLAGVPFDCDAVDYAPLGGTGWVDDDAVLPWMSLVTWREGRRSYFFHTAETNIGPGSAVITFPPGAGPGTGRAGDRVAVTWAVSDVPGYGDLGGTSVVEHCGFVRIVRP
jgi:hypothetical protein